MTNCLLADIGGTRARFAVLSGSRLEPVHALEVGAYASAVDAIRHFVNVHANGARFDGAIIAAAGPIAGGRCALTNSTWVLETDELKRTFGLSTVNIVNDLEALAWAVPSMASSDSEQVGGGTEVAGEPIALIAPGTGLGMACFIPGGDGGRVLASEGGHSTLAATNAREAALIDVLRRQYGHVSAERVLSGGGLIGLYAAIAELEGNKHEMRSAEQITGAAIEGSCGRSRQTLDVFCSFLGSVAGNAALMFGARGGVFIGGGIVPRIVDYVRRTSFRAQFESKGRFRQYLARIQTRVIVRADPAFLGLKALAERAACGR
jgi:glucokinase